MTLEERMEVIRKKAKADANAEINVELERQNKTKAAFAEIEKLTPRIEALIALANECIANKVKFPSSAETMCFGYGSGTYGFVTDGFYHHVGFWKKRNDLEIRFIGIDEGGACGCWDFYTDGKHTFLQHEENAGKTKKAELSYMNAFLKEFDAFETAFYKWIDRMADNI